MQQEVYSFSVDKNSNLIIPLKENRGNSGEIFACMNCKINHRKCDGRPCSYCVKRNIECVDNPKRKAIGRPKMTEEEKKQRKMERLEKMVFEKNKLQLKSLNRCPCCNSVQDENAKFCNQCGNKFESFEEKYNKMREENERLKQKIEELSKQLEKKQSETCNLWVLMKLAIPEEKKLYNPVPAFIIEASPAFLELMGYEDLTGVFFPDLVPKKHHKIYESGQMKVEIVKVEGLHPPRVMGRNKTSLRHKDGHYITFDVKFLGFMDMSTKKPSVCLYVVEKIVNLNVHEDDLPPFSVPSEFKFMCGLQDDPPENMRVFEWIKNQFSSNPQQGLNSSSSNLSVDPNGVVLYNSQQTPHSDFFSTIFGESVDIDTLFSNY